MNSTKVYINALAHMYYLSYLHFPRLREQWFIWLQCEHLLAHLIGGITEIIDTVALLYLPLSTNIKVIYLVDYMILWNKFHLRSN